jgi:hypothetical protein
VKSPVRWLVVAAAATAALFTNVGLVSARPASDPQFVTAERAGPMNLAGHRTLTSIAQVALGVGRWVVMAKADIIEESGRQETTCVLVSDGRTFDTSHVSLVSSPLSESRQTVELMGWVAIKRATPVSLQCSQPGVVGEVAAADIGISAMLTGTITTSGIGGSASDPVTHGIDKPVVVAAHDDVPHGIFQGPVTKSQARLETLDLPAGGWLVFSKATIVISKSSWVSCQVAMGGDFDQTDTKRADNGEGTVGFLVTHSSATPFHVTLSCGADGGAAAAKEIRIVAVRAPTLINGPSPQRMPVPAIPRKPIVEATYLDGPTHIITADDGGGLLIIADIDLPGSAPWNYYRGTWVSFAKLYAGNAGGKMVLCEIETHFNDAGAAIGEGAAENQDLPFQPPSSRHPFELMGPLQVQPRADGDPDLEIGCRKEVGQGAVDEPPAVWFVKLVMIRATVSDTRLPG